MKRLIYTGPYEQHIGTPLYPGLPMVLPGVPVEVPEEIAAYLLTQPDWREAKDADGPAAA